jgi:hypothetical protein
MRTKESGMVSPELIKVVYYSDYRAEESPIRFYMGEKKIEVKAIIDRWLAPDHRYFKVGGDDKAMYVLRHETVTDAWELTMFDRVGI